MTGLPPDYLCKLDELLRASPDAPTWQEVSLLYDLTRGKEVWTDKPRKGGGTKKERISTATESDKAGAARIRAHLLPFLERIGSESGMFRASEDSRKVFCAICGAYLLTGHLPPDPEHFELEKLNKHMRDVHEVPSSSFDWNKPNSPFRIERTYPSQVGREANYGETDLMNLEASRREVIEFFRDSPERYFVYINERKGLSWTVTTWMGDVLGHVIWKGDEFTSGGFGGTQNKRQNIRVEMLDGSRYSGTYYKSNGTYARIRRLK